MRIVHFINIVLTAIGWQSGLLMLSGGVTSRDLQCAPYPTLFGCGQSVYFPSYLSLQRDVVTETIVLHMTCLPANVTLQL